MEDEEKMTENNHSKNRPILWIFLAFILGFMLPVGTCLGSGLVAMGALLQIGSQDTAGLGTGGDTIAVIELEGTISSESSSGVMSAQSMITPGQVDELLKQAGDLESVKAVVMHINSPGGSAVASDEIYHKLLDFEKPVVIWMGDTAASGGFYISCGGDYVMAHPDTLTGSIGVISQFINAEELLKELGVDVMVITSGSHKDMGSLFRDMTEEEREIWDGILDQIYADFVRVVARSRDLSEEKVRELADGRVYSGRQAFELGLVDQVGLPADALSKAAELGGIVGEYKVIELQRTPSLFESLSGFQMRSSVPTWEDILSWAGVPSLEFRFTGP
ncbi:MAG: signal peptide peptidase SppA [Anaerolineales bacterium]|nr:signal peptide peptidase SppA [Anaerolineales bacterium]